MQSYQEFLDLSVGFPQEGFEIIDDELYFHDLNLMEPGLSLHRRALGIHHLAKSGQQPRGQPIERLAGLHQIQIMIGRQLRDRQDLIEQAAMLGGHANPYRCNF